MKSKYHLNCPNLCQILNRHIPLREIKMKGTNSPDTQSPILQIHKYSNTQSRALTLWKVFFEVRLETRLLTLVTAAIDTSPDTT